MADSTNSKAIPIAKAYGALTRALAERGNAERIRVAQANFDTTRTQIVEQKSQRASELSAVFQNHIATIQANAAFRGIGGGSPTALITSEGAKAEVARRNIDINANNAIGSAAAQASVQIEDPNLAEIEGTFKGLSIGSDFTRALDSLPARRSLETEWVNTGLGYQAVQRTRETPQTVDLREMFPELDRFLRGA